MPGRRPGERARHVEDLLLLQQLVTDAAGGADKFGNDDDTRCVAQIDLPRREHVGQDRRDDEHAHHLEGRRAKAHHHFGEILRHGTQLLLAGVVAEIGLCRRLENRQLARQIHLGDKRQMIGSQAGERRIVNSKFRHQTCRPAENTVERENGAP